MPWLQEKVATAGVGARVLYGGIYTSERSMLVDGDRVRGSLCVSLLGKWAPGTMARAEAEADTTPKAHVALERGQLP